MFLRRKSQIFLNHLQKKNLDDNQRKNQFINRKSQFIASNFKIFSKNPINNTNSMNQNLKQLPFGLQAEDDTTSVISYGGRQVDEQHQQGNFEEAYLSNLNLQEIQQSTFNTTSRLITHPQTGETILRREVQVVPETSSVKDPFVRKNIEGEEYSKIIMCEKLNPTKLTEKVPLHVRDRIKVKVEKFEIVYDGIFSTEYAIYEVRTESMDWVVQRRFSDFEWLYNSLLKSFPGSFIPPIARKTTMKEFTDRHLYERMRNFELFLNEIIFSQNLFASTQYADFLSITDYKVFKARCKEQESKPVLIIADKMSNATGEVVSEVTPSLREFWIQFTDSMDKSCINYDSMVESVNQMQNQLKKAADESNNIGESYLRMGKVHEQFNRLSPLGKNPVLETINANLNNFFVDFAETLSSISIAFEKNIFEYIRYQKLMLEDLKTDSEERNEMQNSYLEKLKKLNEKKEKLLGQTNTSKWGLDQSCPLSIQEILANKSEAVKYMLPQETKAIQSEGEFFGIVNKGLFDDVNMFMQSTTSQVSNRFINLSQDLALQINKLHIRIAEMSMLFAETQGKNVSLNQRYRND